MVNYQNGKIYKIVSRNCDEIYVGSTTQPLSKRLHQHIRDHQTDNIYVSSSEVIKHGRYEILLVEHYPCRSREELTAREGFYIEELNCVNKNAPATLEDFKSNSIRCDDCGKDILKSNYTRHLRTKKHLINAGLMEKEEYRYCNVNGCRFVTKNANSLSNHKRIKHKGMEIECKACGDGITLKNSIKNILLHSMSGKHRNALKTIFGQTCLNGVPMQIGGKIHFNIKSDYHLYGLKFVDELEITPEHYCENPRLHYKRFLSKINDDLPNADRRFAKCVEKTIEFYREEERTFKEQSALVDEQLKNLCEEFEALI